MIEQYDNIVPPIIQKDIVNSLSDENFSWFLKENNKKEHYFEHILFHNGLINSSFYDIIVEPIVSIVKKKTYLDISNLIYAKAIFNSNTKQNVSQWVYDVYTLIYCVEDSYSDIIVKRKDENNYPDYFECKKGRIILTDNDEIINDKNLEGNKKIIMIQFANLKTKEIQ